MKKKHKLTLTYLKI